MKNHCVYWNKTTKHATAHSTSCPHVAKHVGLSGGDLPQDPKGRWGYAEFDTAAEADKCADEYGTQPGWIVKEHNNETCRALRGL